MGIYDQEFLGSRRVPSFFLFSQPLSQGGKRDYSLLGRLEKTALLISMKGSKTKTLYIISTKKIHLTRQIAPPFSASRIPGIMIKKPLPKKPKMLGLFLA